jgi:hypothetical protein
MSLLSGTALVRHLEAAEEALLMRSAAEALAERQHGAMAERLTRHNRGMDAQLAEVWRCWMNR